MYVFYHALEKKESKGGGSAERANRLLTASVHNLILVM